MKKLVTFAVAMAAVSAMAAVTSENIVGYMWKSAVAGGYESCCTAFVPVGGNTSSEMTLADIIPNDSFEAFSDTIVVLGKNSAPILRATYMSQGFITENGLDGITPGWYDYADENMENNLNGYVLPFGSMFMVNASSSATKILLAGEVYAQAVVLQSAGAGYSNLGNASPVDITLGDIVPDASFEPFADTLVFLGANSAPTLRVTYMSPEFIAENGLDGIVPGWYDYADEDMANPLNDTVVKAGQGFMASTALPVKFTIPAAIPSSK